MSRYENYEIKNNVFGTLSAPISSLATTIQLGDGQGQRFSENMLATLESIENGKVMKREIVLITAINGDTLTVERKYAPCPANDDANTQGRVSYAFSTDDTISAYIDKEHFDEIDKSINDIYDNGVNKLRTEVVSGLQIKVNAGPVLVGSAYYDFAGNTITLTDNATNYIEISENGVLVANTTGWNDKNAKVAIVVTSGGEVTNITDRRLGTVGGEISKINIHDLTEKQILSPNDEFVLSDSDNIYNNKKVKAGTIFSFTQNYMGEPTNLALELIDDTHLGVKYKDPVISTPSIRTIPDSANDWLESYIYMKEGAEPTGPEDGTIINISTTKDEYENNGFSKVIEDGKDYYFRIVSKADNGIRTYCDFEKFSTKYKIDFLLIGGGGGGGTGSGYNKAGGGGAGGVIYKQNTYLSMLECPVVLGGGGNSDTDGEDSTFMGYVAKGGGAGGPSSTDGNDGGSGGGGGGNSFGGPNQGGSGTTGQGNNGGNGYRGDYAGGGGGGGAGGVGGSGGYNSGGTGGIGIENDISGTLTQYAGGGGGGGSGSYGGGNAGQDATTYGSGGGGGSPWSSTAPGGKGKQGILIIRYLTASGITATGGTITTSGNYTIHTFTSNGTFTVIE